ncbi:brachyurin-like [Episyrphus balteatus]|uniref:brachyurin-like n=1 Tax=Episyrphus balteatus TaxID=286459 RepID=UPI002485B295|nr:brachyurin-like [Episyrphus balteatus]
MKVVFALALLVACATAGTIRQSGGRITNGDVASVGQFPYQVGLALDMGKQSSWCGGTLISHEWIVTAAHCTVDADGVTVYLGATNIKDDNEPGQQRVYVSKSGIFTHEEYDGTTITNDIALIKLPAPIEYNELIQPASLPKKSETYSTFVGDTVVASGWGKDSDSATSVSPVLNYIDTTVISSKTCNRYYLGMITPNMICISGKDGRSTCNGDSGGPLVYQENGENMLIGLTSFGISLGCEVGFPGVFTRITSYLDWIEAKTDLVN